MLVVIDLKMRMSSANSVCSARMANSLSGCSRAARDFLGMSCVLERVVPHPGGFVCLSTGNSGDFPPQPLGPASDSGNLHVRGSCKLDGPKKREQNFLPLISGTEGTSFWTSILTPVFWAGLS